MSTSFGSVASSRSGMVSPIRVSVFVNGAGPGSAGRRVVLDRGESLGENVGRIAHKLGLRCAGARVFTQHGIEVGDVDELIEGEVLFFAAGGESFRGPSGAGVSGVSGMSGAMSVGSSSTRRRSRRRSRGSVASSPRELVRGNSFEYDYLFKFILVGSVAVGKSCLLLRFTDRRFRATHETTIGVDFGTETIRVRGEHRVKIQIWDTAGQEYFKAITRAYFRQAAAALIVYDVSNRESFEDLKQWLDNVRSTSTNRSLVITLVGNKSDVDAGQRVVSQKEGETFARENGLLFLETSALSGDHVREAFARTADAVLRKLDAGLIDLEDPMQGVRRGEFGAKPRSVASPTYQLNVHDDARLGTEHPAVDDDDSCYC